MFLIKSALLLVILGLVNGSSRRLTDGPCIINGEFLPHRSFCTKFYKCDLNELVVFDCPAGLHWNDAAKLCDWPQNAKCNIENGSCDKTKPPPTCPNHNPEGLAVLLPHQYNCTKFYKCDFGTAHELDCPIGLNFNAHLSVCDWPSNTPCQCSVEPAPCSENSKPQECPEHDPSGQAVHLPHENDCRKFYKCDWGVRYLFNCPAYLHFNPISQVCDWPFAANCACANINN